MASPMIGAVSETGRTSYGPPVNIYLARAYGWVIEGETATPRVRLPAKLRTVEPFYNLLGQVDSCTVNRYRYIVFPWLFQSQSQTGATSAIATHIYTEPHSIRLPAETTDYLSHRFR